MQVPYTKKLVSTTVQYLLLLRASFDVLVDETFTCFLDVQCSPIGESSIAGKR